jgi:hypothetical protein
MAELGGKGFGILGSDDEPQYLAARSTVAMVAGISAFSSTFWGGKRPRRDDIVDELVQANLHGFLHRTTSKGQPVSAKRSRGGGRREVEQTE